MKVYEYLSEVFANNAIDVEEINSISVVYLKIGSKFDHTSWKLVHKELRSTDGVPINPMHLEEWDDDIWSIYKADTSVDEIIMSIGIKLLSGLIFYSLYCTIDPINTMMIAD